MPTLANAALADHLASLTTASLGKPLDPYLVWADLTDFRYCGEAHHALAFAVELRPGNTAEALRDSLAAGDKHLRRRFVSDLFVQATEGLHDARYCVVRIMGKTRAETRAHIKQLLDDGSVARAELAAPVAQQPHALSELAQDTQLLRLKRADETPYPDAPHTCVGVIDDFVGYAHQAMWGKHASRVTWVWHQDGMRRGVAPVGIEHFDPAQPGAVATLWGDARTAGRGAELAPQRVSRGAPARVLEQTYPRFIGRSSHGSHVASLALEGLLEMIPLIAVHLPRATVMDTSGGSMSAQILEGLRYILLRAGDAANVAVNISYATHAGPHDGTSILEMAMDELVAKRQNKLAIVLPAGNAYEARCHARVPLAAKGQAQSRQVLPWRVLPDDQTPNFMEIWLPDGASVGASDGDDQAGVSLKLTAPDGSSSGFVKPGSVWHNGAKGVAPSCAVVYLRTVANGTRGTMALLVVAPTRLRGSQAEHRPGQAQLAAAPHGVWQVSLQNQTHTPIDVRVWVERNDSLLGHANGGRQSYLLDSHCVPPGRRPGPTPDHPLSLVQRQGAFNTIATGQHTVAVGGAVGQSHPLRCASYSGGGPNRPGGGLGVHVLAVSEASEVMHGLRAAGTRGTARWRMNGTSVAAPQVTWKIAQLMAANDWPTAKPAQWKALLGKQRLGTPDPRFGFGVLAGGRSAGRTERDGP